MNHPKGKYAWTVKVGEKGQIVLPKEARDVFNIHPGDTLIIVGDEKRGIAIPLQKTVEKLMTLLLQGEMSEEEDE